MIFYRKFGFFTHLRFLHPHTPALLDRRLPFSTICLLLPSPPPPGSTTTWDITARLRHAHHTHLPYLPTALPILPTFWWLLWLLPPGILPIPATTAFPCVLPHLQFLLFCFPQPSTLYHASLVYTPFPACHTLHACRFSHLPVPPATPTTIRCFSHQFDFRYLLPLWTTYRF